MPAQGPRPEPREGEKVRTGADFNGDGYRDLAVAQARSGGTGQPIPGNGLVQVLYGSARGFAAAASQRWSPSEFGLDTSHGFSLMLTSGDFDQDEYSDLVMADPPRGPETSGAGNLLVLYGSPRGLSPARAQVWSQDTPGVPDDGENGDAFGGAVAAGNIGYGPEDDLAIGVPGEDGVGAVQILFGTATGLTADRAQIWCERSPGVPGAPEKDDQFGAALVTGDFDGGGYDELVVGVPGDRTFAGAVHVLRGTPAGLTTRRAQFWAQERGGIRGNGDNEAMFGSALAVGRFSGSGHLDLAVGSPNQTILDTGGAGAVNVIYGTPRGLSAARNQYWSEFSLGVRTECDCDAPTEHPAFGVALLADDFGRSDADDLVIGVPGALAPGLDSGAVQVLYGTPSGLTSAGTQRISQDTPGIRGSDPDGAQFGIALAIAGPSTSSAGYPTLVVGAPDYNGSEDEMSTRGVINLIHGSATGLTTAGNDVWSAKRLGRKPVGLRFGQTLTS